MKIGIYTDLHLCKTTSILPLHSGDSSYSTRLQMCIDTAKWMYELFWNQGVDIIVNGGDTLDAINVSAEEVSALSEFYAYSRGTREIHIAGNHESYAVNSEFYTNKILDNLPFVELYTSPCKINDTISVLPYMRAEDVTEELLSSIKNKFLISHIDLKGTHLRDDFVAPDGVDLQSLVSNFDFVANGHMHMAEKLDISHCKGKRGKQIHNIGAVTSGSFSDNNIYRPSVCIYDSESNTIERFYNPYAILFRTINSKTLSAFNKSIKALDDNYRYCIRATVPYDLKDAVKEIISTKENIIASRVTLSEIKNNIQVKVNSNTDTGVTEEQNTDIAEKFIGYLKTVDSLKYPIDDYIQVVKEVT